MNCNKNIIILLVIVVCLIFIKCKKVNASHNQVNETINVISKSKKEIKQNKGSLICEKNRITYGKVKEGESIKQNFLFYNEGTEPVRIVRYDASCNCTVLDIKGKVIPPKESLDIEMKIDTKNKSNGAHTANVTLESTGQRKFHVLIIKYDIE